MPQNKPRLNRRFEAYCEKLQMPKPKAYYVDLDRTLAKYDGWKGAEYIGEPIKPMLEMVKKWLREGKIVKIFTARANRPENIHYVDEWLNDNGIGGLEITNIKGEDLFCIFDDRCVQVEPNTGKILGDISKVLT